MEWPALESDPGILTDYMKRLGLRENWEFQEIFDMDEDFLHPQAILLTYSNVNEAFPGTAATVPVFIKQVQGLGNACGLIACLHALGNLGADIEPGSTLDSLFQQLRGKTSEESGHFLYNYQNIRDAHQEFSCLGQSEQQDDTEYHFIAVLPGFIICDGMRATPIQLNCQGDLFTGFIGEVRRMLAEGRISDRISLIGLVRNS